MTKQSKFWETAAAMYSMMVGVSIVELSASLEVPENRPKVGHLVLLPSLVSPLEPDLKTPQLKDREWSEMDEVEDSFQL